MDVSHSMRAIAISQVSLTTISSPSRSRYCVRSDKLSASPRAPSASAASCLHMASSFTSDSTSRRGPTAANLPVCPRQYANSCFNKADGVVKAAAMASIAAVEVAPVSAVAKCLSENKTLNRVASEVASEHSVLLRLAIASSGRAEALPASDVAISRFVGCCAIQAVIDRISQFQSLRVA